MYKTLGICPNDVYLNKFVCYIVHGFFLTTFKTLCYEKYGKMYKYHRLKIMIYDKSFCQKNPSEESQNKIFFF